MPFPSSQVLDFQSAGTGGLTVGLVLGVFCICTIVNPEWTIQQHAKIVIDGIPALSSPPLDFGGESGSFRLKNIMTLLVFKLINCQEPAKKLVYLRENHPAQSVASNVAILEVF